jgi:hypothetical protein
MAVARKDEGYGWISFSAIMLILVGLLDIVNGIRGIGAQDTTFDVIFWDNNIEAWGWFYLIVGVILFVAGWAIFSRARWAVMVGIAAGVIAAVLNMFWVFVYPIASLIIIMVALLVVYGLVNYGLNGRAGEDYQYR